MSAQFSLLPDEARMPSMPKPYSNSWLALLDLIQGPLTQLDWLNMGRGWRLAAAVKELDYLGWKPGSEWVLADGCPNPIKRYHLPDEMIALAADRLKGGRRNGRS